jgi:hypothetical protein
MIAWLITGILTGTTFQAALAVGRRRLARSWMLLEDWDSDDQDLLPLFDQVEHDAGEDCICGPRTIPVECEDGEIRWIYKHHSLDGRERDGTLA